ncbi:MAG: regulatory protein RecX, partial [Myxococcota bacterium]
SFNQSSAQAEASSTVTSAWALDWLKDRDWSEEELRCALRAQQVDDEAIEDVCRAFREYNYVNDARLAHQQTRMWMEQGWGPQHIRRKLTERGVPLELVMDALAVCALDGPHVWEQHAQAWVRAWFGKPPQALERAQQLRAYRLLRHRGFVASVAFHLLWGQTSAPHPTHQSPHRSSQPYVS